MENLGILKDLLMVERLLKILMKKKKPGILQGYRLCALCGKCFREDHFFNKHVEYCESVR